MDDVIKRFRELSPRLHGRAWHTPDAQRLRQSAITVAQRLVADGHTPGEVARRFGVARFTMRRWLTSTPPLREVALVAAPPSPQFTSGAVMVLPSGVRIEGLSLDEITALARALA